MTLTDEQKSVSEDNDADKMAEVFLDAEFYNEKGFNTKNA